MPRMSIDWPARLRAGIMKSMSSTARIRFTRFEVGTLCALTSRLLAFTFTP